MAPARSKKRGEVKTPQVERSAGSQLFKRQTQPPFLSFSLMRRFADEMDRVFEDFGFPTMERVGRSWGMERFSPQIDIFERDSKLVIRADLPGMSKEDVTVDVTEDAVVIEGERKFEHEENEQGVYRSERSYGRFHREIDRKSVV